MSEVVRQTRRVIVGGAVLCAAGCAAPDVDFSTITRPQRASELDAYNVFVGEWDWQAEVVNADGPGKNWKGTAKWEWTLDKRCLRGVMKSQSDAAGFQAEGVWSWHPKKRKYIWWMFNDWGYPQQGTAKYNEGCDCWTMDYQSVGLDGTTSYGCYCVCVKDNDTLKWKMAEWADPLRLFPKIEMTGTYTRKK